MYIIDSERCFQSPNSLTQEMSTTIYRQPNWFWSEFVHITARYSASASWPEILNSDDDCIKINIHSVYSNLEKQQIKIYLGCNDLVMPWAGTKYQHNQCNRIWNHVIALRFVLHAQKLPWKFFCWIPTKLKSTYGCYAMQKYDVSGARFKFLEGCQGRRIEWQQYPIH